MPRNSERTSRKLRICRSLSGCSGVSAQARWLISSVMPWFSDWIRLASAATSSGRESEPVHAGVHVQRHAAAPVVGGDERIPFGELDQVADYRPRVDLRIARSPLGREPVEHVDHRFGREPADPPRLRQMGNEKSAAARLGERDGDRLDAAAIAVGLDHGGSFRGRDAARDRAPIGFEGGEIDAEDAAGLGLRRAGGGDDDRLRCGL